ncbi:UD11 glucuronosyltransferase, partial [Tyrannus savana]|nr:UD11 glucuronosyltransferase [Tyrannus savana]
MASGLAAPLPFTVGVVVLLSLLGLAAGGKVLVVPVDGSHWLSMLEVLDGLRQRGHEVVVVAPEVNLHIKPSKNIVMKMYPVPFTQEEMDENVRGFTKDLFEGGSFLERFIRFYQRSKKSSALFLATCTHLLYNRELMRYLEDSKFDAILTDPFLPCGQIVAEHLSVPSLFFLQQMPCGLEHQATQCPNPPSYVPRAFTDLTDHMTFLQRRVKNLLIGLSEPVLCYLFYTEYRNLASEFLQRDVTMQELFSKASVMLMRYDFVFEFPRPVMPNMVYVGGINCVQKKPLSEEFEAMVNASGEHGVVVFSLGSMVSEIPMKKAMEIADALGTVPQTVLWRYTGPTPPNLPKNVKLVKWLPQNDLL